MIGAIDVDSSSRPASKTEQFAGTSRTSRPSSRACAKDAPIAGELVLQERSARGSSRRGRSGDPGAPVRPLPEDFERGFSVDVQELFVPFPHEDSDEYPLDPEGSWSPTRCCATRSASSSPYAPACRPDCRGLCARCGGDPEPRRVHVRGGHRCRDGTAWTRCSTS